ncbi:MAG TPA: LLM class flavin-dependent oxidoreductase [Thermoanaerobaculia bacterium]|nr:LLM class flavin-dependent oxidoreductase [Thermoanaerobaculia bacterium]
MKRRPLRLFSTCPPSTETDPAEYIEHASTVARWCEEWGCEGILVYADNGQLDPWSVAHVILRATRRLAPLVAVQPVYMHPYCVAKIVTTLGNLYQRRLFLNMVAGGFRGDLDALGDTTPHDRRYERLVEYTTIVKSLLESPEPVRHAGSFYEVENLRLKPALDADLVPGIFVSGSSRAGVEAARALGATVVKYPQPAGQEDEPSDAGLEHGVRVGIIARADSREAWRTAHARFPPDRRGQLAHQLAMKASDSMWHAQLSRLADVDAAEGNPYWLFPFQNYSTMCPYLVGSYQEVSRELERYIALGYTTFILDVPASEEELHHSMLAFDHALLREVAL